METTRSTDASTPRHSVRFAALVLLGAGGCIAGSVALRVSMSHVRLALLPLHSATEALISLSALVVSAFLLLLLKDKRLPSYYVWIASGLLAGGVLDGFYAAVSPGSTFVWLHNVGAMAGGILCAMVWLPGRIAESRPARLLPIGVLAGSIGLGAFSFAAPGALPAMLHQGMLTAAANSLMLVAWLSFLSAGTYLLLRYRADSRLEDLLFAGFCLIRAWAAFLSHSGHVWGVWTASWWFWHGLRLLASLVVLSFLFIASKRAQDALRKAHDELEDRVRERTAELRLANESLLAEMGERKRAEARTQHINSVLRAIRNVNQLITKEKDRGKLLQGACDNLTETRGCLTAWVALLDGPGKVVATAMSGLVEESAAMEARLARDELPGCASNALSQSAVVITEDTVSDCGDCPLAQGCSGRTAMAARLEHGGRVYGLMVASGAKGLADAEERALFEELAGDIAFALRNLDLERERALSAEALQRSQRELSIRNQIADIFLTIADEEMYAEVLRVVLKAMGSEHGVFGCIDDNGDLVVPTMTRTVWDECQVPDKRFVFPRETWGDGTWPRAIREARTIFTNETSTRTPHGHIEIRRHISLPILLHGEAIGLIQVANKETDYTDEDIRLLEAIGSHIAPVLNARLQRDRKEADRQEALEILRERTDALQRSNTELEQFAYVSSHDLQEPLRMVASYAQLLSARYKGKLDQAGDEFIEYLVDGATRMQHLIQALLDYSRVGTRGKDFEPTTLQGVLDRTLSNLQAALEESGAQVISDPLPTVMADEVQLGQVFQNLIGNAVKFRGKKPPRVHVSAQEKEGEWVFSVRDNGIGIDPDQFDRIFVIFQRLHARGEYPGTGIGLAISKKIVERHGGRIWAESEPGKGSTFYFTIPEKGEESSGESRIRKAG